MNPKQAERNRRPIAWEIRIALEKHLKENPPSKMQVDRKRRYATNSLHVPLAQLRMIQLVHPPGLAMLVQSSPSVGKSVQDSGTRSIARHRKNRLSHFPGHKH